MKDAESPAEAAEAKMAVDQISAAKVEALLAELCRTPKAVIEEAGRAIQN